MVTKEKSKVKMLRFQVPIIIEPDEQHFYAHSPALPGLQVGGDTDVEALQNARDGAIALLHSMIHDGDPIPLSIQAMYKNESAKPEENNYTLHLEEITVKLP
jgi:predicted RNase H-like HicB family nuclease